MTPDWIKSHNELSLGENCLYFGLWAILKAPLLLTDCKTPRTQFSICFLNTEGIHPHQSRPFWNASPKDQSRWMPFAVAGPVRPDNLWNSIYSQYCLTQYKLYCLLSVSPCRASIGRTFFDFFCCISIQPWTLHLCHWHPHGMLIAFVWSTTFDLLCTKTHLH